MSVEISPSAQLGFARPLTKVVKRSLHITNSNSQPVAFKVKTTAPKQYCVRPNSGRIEPGERVEVQVLLQPLKEEPPMNAKCRDKFLIQSTVISADKETLPIAEFWSMQEGNKSGISEHKIRCAYLPASSATVPEENEDVSGASMVGAGAGAGAGYMASSSPSNTSVGAEPPVSIASLSGNAAAVPVTRSTTTSSSGSAVPVAAQSVSMSTPRTTQEMEAEILRLRTQLAAQEKWSVSNGSVMGGTASTARVATQKAVSTGVPVHIVAAIAVGVFAITYLFF
ncbi:phosphatidylinositol-binding protein Scs2 [Malassezia pachydermatis]|uniref:Vamp-associated protein n=1 Tax=Malassezia pachydermatis TaxID=77020 RepID=A0A0M8MSE7_9BASI|nr:vamp-associated protein [Malassezia pachydermatis]KOS12850.1 vamp-associated protein [Malassezia pachydermatis]